MGFRWFACLTLWTLLSGPMIAVPRGTPAGFNAKSTCDPLRLVPRAISSSTLMRTVR
jgi:hypothetical protein